MSTSLTWVVSNQPHFLAIYRSTLIILYTLLASSYSDCLIACLELILTTIFGLLFNLVSLDCWVPALNNALEAVLCDINNPWCRQLVLCSNDCPLCAHSSSQHWTDSSRSFDSPRLVWPLHIGHQCQCTRVRSRVSCHHLNITLTLCHPSNTPNWVTTQEWALSSQSEY